MNEKSKRIYNAVTEIDDELVEEAETGSGGARKQRVRFAVIAAAAVLVLSAIAAGTAMRVGRSAGPGESAHADGFTSTDVPGTDASSAEESETENDAQVKDYSPVPISSLSIPSANVNSSIHGDGRADIALLREKDIVSGRSISIIEGRVTNVYTKEYVYRYRTAGEEWDTIDKTWTCIYEIEIGKVWYGDEFSAGQTVVVEDEWNGPVEPVTVPVEGRTYVFPIEKMVSNEIYHIQWVRPRIEGEVTGETERTSRYEARDAFLFRITKTDGGEYLVHTGYTTLTAEPCRHVIIDDESILGGITPYFSDKIRLLDGEEFAARMDDLIGKYLK